MVKIDKAVEQLFQRASNTWRVRYASSEQLRKQGDNKFFVDAAASSITGEDNKSNDVLARLLHQHFLRHLLCGASALLSNATGIMRFELIGERKWPSGLERVRKRVERGRRTLCPSRFILTQAVQLRLPSPIGRDESKAIKRVILIALPFLFLRE